MQKRLWLDSVTIAADGRYKLLASPGPDAFLIMCRFVSDTRERGMSGSARLEQTEVYLCARTTSQQHSVFQRLKRSHRGRRIQP